MLTHETSAVIPRMGVTVDNLTTNTTISTPLPLLSEALAKAYLLRGENGAARTKQWMQFTRSVEVAVNLYYSKKLHGVLDYWKETPTTARGYEFLECMDCLLTAAQYSLISPDLFYVAEVSSFDNDVPTTVRYSQLMDEPFTKWLRKNKKYLGGSAESGSTVANNSDDSGLTDAPFFAQHMLIYTCGLFSLTATGVFFTRKLELLLTEVMRKVCLKVPGLAIFAPLSIQEMKALALRAEQRRVEARRLALHDKDPACEDIGAEDSAMHGKSEDLTHADGESSEFQKQVHEEESQLEALSEALGRYTVEDFVKEHGWNGLFKPVTVKEKMFDSVVLLYRRRAGARSWIDLREYVQVPLGDLQVLYPCKHVQLPPLQTLTFIVEVFLCVLFLHLAMSDYLHSEDDSIILSLVLFVGLLGRLWALVSSYLSSVAFLEGKLERWIDKRRHGRNSAIACNITSKVCNQETKEIIVPYFFLHVLGAQKEEDLALVIKRFFENEVKEVKGFAFELPDSLEKLKIMGLASCSDTGLWSATMSPSEWLEEHSADGVYDIKVREK